MSSAKQQKKQTKREKKAHKEAQREAARRAERRLNLMMVAIIALVVAVGGAIMALTIIEDRRERAAAEAEEAERLAQIEEELDAIENRPIACDADEPPGVDSDKPTFEDGPEQVVTEELEYRAVIDTSCGEVVLELHADVAPETVNAFVFLAEEGFYDGLEIFRISEGLDVLQTGSGTNTTAWDVGFTVPDELDLAEAEGYPVGSVAMANNGPDTSGSQFFLVYGDGMEALLGENPVYTRFADVISGLEILIEMGERGAVGQLVGPEIPAEIVYMETVRIETEPQ